MVATPSKQLQLDSLAREKTQHIDYRTRGRTGLRMFGGYVLDDTIKALQGTRGLDVYREMGDTDATCGTILYVIDKIVRQVKWTVSRASDHPADRQAAEFLDQCKDDMDTTFTDLVSEILTMCQFGFSLHELVYKRRCGDADEGWLQSKYKDGRVGWRGMPIRSQETINRWITDDLGNFVGVEQIAPPDSQAVFIPWEKLALFRTSTHKNSPLGRSIFRCAFRSWYLKRGIENIEGIGVERDIAGIPVALVPPEVLAQATEEDQKLFARVSEIVSNIKNDEQASVVFPMAYDDNGKPMFELKLLNAAGSKQFDTDKIISRYDSRIAMTALADFVLLGQNASQAGSFAMHQDKTALFTQSMSAILDIVAQTFNEVLIPRLFRLNNFKVTDYPTLEHGDVGQRNVTEAVAMLTGIAQTGAQVWPNDELQARLYDMVGLPPPPDDSQQGVPQVDPLGPPDPDEVNEVHDGDVNPETDLPPNTAQANAFGGGVLPSSGAV